MLLVGCPQTKDHAVTPEQKEAAARQHLLEDLVAAPDRRSFSERLRTYGPIEAQEVPYLASQARSWRQSLRHNAVRLLAMGRSPDALVALRKLASETDDAFVYAVAVERLAETHDPADQALAGSRPKLLHEALAQSDPDVVAAALRAGVAAKLPGIEAELDRRLSGGDAKVRDAVLDALAHSGPGALVGRLKAMALQPPANLHGMIELYMALCRSDDPSVAEVFRAVVKDPKRGGDLGSGINLSKSKQPWLRALLLEWLRSSDLELRFRALQSLPPTFGDERAVQREIVALCLHTLEQPAPTEPMQPAGSVYDACFRHLRTLADNDRAFIGEDHARVVAEAHTFAQTWLDAHP